MGSVSPGAGEAKGVATGDEFSELGGKLSADVDGDCTSGGFR